MRIGDGLMGFMFIALGVVVGIRISTFPSGSLFGPSLFPSVIAAGIFLCGALLVVRAARSASPEEYAIRFFGPIKSKRAALYAALIIIASSSYVFLGDTVGFQIITFIWLFVLHALLRRRIIISLLSAVIITLVFDLVFRHVLHVPLPGGIFAALLY